MFVNVILFTNMSLKKTAFVYYISVDGQDGNSGDSPETALKTLDAVHKKLVDLKPDSDVRILILPGNYYCRDMEEKWTYFHPKHTVSIEPYENVPSPAFHKDSVNHPSRPVFLGKTKDGGSCTFTDDSFYYKKLDGTPQNRQDERSIWMSIEHGLNPVNLTIQGLRISSYRGGITIQNNKDVITRVNQNITIRNMVFQRIGDSYSDSRLEGKGVILLNYTFGNHFIDNYFQYIRNSEATAGLVHAIYFAQASSRNRVLNNTFHSITGSAIKLTHFSNQNVFEGNRFSYVAQSVTDRWCGAREKCDKYCIESKTEATVDPVTKVKTEKIVCVKKGPQCPSWGNRFHKNKNISADILNDGLSVRVYPTKGQTCEYPAPEKGLRFEYNEGEWFDAKGGGF